LGHSATRKKTKLQILIEYQAICIERSAAVTFYNFMSHRL